MNRQKRQQPTSTRIAAFILLTFTASVSPADEPPAILFLGGDGKHVASGLQALDLPFDQASMENLVQGDVCLFDYRVVICGMDERPHGPRCDQGCDRNIRGVGGRRALLPVVRPRSVAPGCPGEGSGLHVGQSARPRSSGFQHASHVRSSGTPGRARRIDLRRALSTGRGAGGRSFRPASSRAGIRRRRNTRAITMASSNWSRDAGGSCCAR